MSRRTLISLCASIILGIGCLAMISNDALAYRAAYRGGAVAYRGGAYRGAAYRGAAYRGYGYRGAYGAAVGAAAVGAAAAGAYGYYNGYYGGYNNGCYQNAYGSLVCPQY